MVRLIERKLHETLETLRGEIVAEKYIEIIAIGSLLAQISKEELFEEQIHIQNVLQAEEKALDVLHEQFINIEKEIPTLKDTFEHLTVFNTLTPLQIVRTLYDINELVKETSGENVLRSFININRGESYNTPASVNTLVSHILNPRRSLYDGTIHYGNSVIDLYKEAAARGESIHIFGQEINVTTLAIAKIHLYLAGVTYFDLAQGNVLTHPYHASGSSVEQFDFVFMDPPFRMRLEEASKLDQDPYNRYLYGLPPATSADFAFASHAIASLKETGKGAVTLASGALFRGGVEGRIRQRMIESDVIEAVISLPGGLYHYTNIPVNIVIFNKNKDHTLKNQIQFIKVTEEEMERKRNQVSIPKPLIEKIVRTLKESKEETNFSRILKIEDLEAGNLLPSRYILPRSLEIEGLGRVNFDVEAIQNKETITLRKHATFRRGLNVSTKHEEKEDGMYKVIRLSDVQNGEILLDEVPAYDIENNARIDMYRVEKGDVIISIRGSQIKVAVVETDIENLLISQNFIGIRCTGGIDPYYLKLFIESPVGQYILKNKMGGSSLPTLAREDIEQLEIPKLSIGKQRESTRTYKKRKEAIKEEIKQLEEQLIEEKLKLHEQMGLKDLYSV